MKSKHILLNMLLGSIWLALAGCTGNVKDAEIEQAFFEKMVSKHQFDKTELENLFASVEIKDDILKRIATPSEGLPWHKYQKIFLTEERVNAGGKFWQDNAQTLADVEKTYGVPASIIVAIIGVETSYGKKTGNYRVIDALSTLAFAYPPRSKFFLSELEQYLLLCRSQHFNPLEPLGSYAGAMGVPQFMPSSFLSFAVDFDHDGQSDIWHNTADVIASVANYFAKHDWHPGQDIAFPVTVEGEISASVSEKYKTALNGGLKPDLRLEELKSLNLKTSRLLPLETKVKLLSFEQAYGEELWAALDNFYVITRYNHSPLYAMAVYQLSNALLKTKGPFP
jgi:membrane-bound lytic murein transglycosylase B